MVWKQEDPVPGQVPVHDVNEDGVVHVAHVLEHADGDDPVELLRGHAAVVLQPEAHGQAPAGRFAISPQ
jgi:hypothetical protein